MHPDLLIRQVVVAVSATGDRILTSDAGDIRPLVATSGRFDSRHPLLSDPETDPFTDSWATARLACVL